MGRMATRIVETARARAEGAIPLLLQLYSAHDSTLFGLLSAFDLSAPATWPEYGARLQVELWREATGRMRLRFVLNGETLRCMGEETIGLEHVHLVRGLHDLAAPGA